MTGPQYSAFVFKVSNTDEQKMDTLTLHPSFYESFDFELLAFVSENWVKWMDDKPDWLTDEAISRIPERFLPGEELERRKKIESRRRRSSALGGIRGGGASVTPSLD
jgi:hypothetical protein